MYCKKYDLEFDNIDSIVNFGSCSDNIDTVQCSRVHYRKIYIPYMEYNCKDTILNGRFDLWFNCHNCHTNSICKFYLQHSHGG